MTETNKTWRVLFFVGSALATFVLVGLYLYSSWYFGGKGDDSVRSWPIVEHSEGVFATAMPVLLDEDYSAAPNGVQSFAMDGVSSDGTNVSIYVSLGIPKKSTNDYWYREYCDGLYGIPLRSEGKLIQFCGQPARSFEGEYINEDGELRWVSARVFSIENNLYDVSLNNQRGRAMAPEQVEAFFQAFELRPLKADSEN